MSIYNKIVKNFNWQTASDKIPYKSYVAELTQTLVSLTDSTLIVGRQYLIDVVEVGDDFTGTGFTAVGVAFTATAVPAPVWSNGTVAVDVVASAPQVFNIQNNTGILFTFGYTGTPGFYYVTTSKPIFTAPTDQKVSINISNNTSNGLNLLNSTTFSIGVDAFIITTTVDGIPENDVLGVLQNVIEIKLYN